MDDLRAEFEGLPGLNFERVADGLHKGSYESEKTNFAYGLYCQGFWAGHESRDPEAEAAQELRKALETIIAGAPSERPLYAAYGPENQAHYQEDNALFGVGQIARKALANAENPR